LARRPLARHCSATGSRARWAGGLECHKSSSDGRMPVEPILPLVPTAPTTRLPLPGTKTRSAAKDRRRVEKPPSQGLSMPNSPTSDSIQKPLPPEHAAWIIGSSDPVDPYKEQRAHPRFPFRGRAKAVVFPPPTSPQNTTCQDSE